MSYATKRQFVDKYGADAAVLLLAGLEKGASCDLLLLDDLLGGGTALGADAEALARALTHLEDALEAQSDLADSYLVQRVSVPLDAAVAAASPLPGYVCDLARYALATRPGTRTKAVTDDRDTALAWLRDVSKGRAGLSGLAGETAAPTGRFVLRSGADAEEESACAMPVWMWGARL